MIKKLTEYRAVSTVDAVLALLIVTVFLTPAHFSLDLRRLLSSEIRTADVLFGVIFIFAWHYCFSAPNQYHSLAVRNRMLEILKRVILITTISVVYFETAHASAISVRNVVALLVALFVYEMNRAVLRVYLLDLLASRDPRRAIILGSGPRASKAWRIIRTRYHKSIKMLGFVDDRDPDEMPPELAQNCIGCVDELQGILLNEIVDVILIAMPIRSCYTAMQRVVTIAESVGVPVIYLHDIYSVRRPTEDPNQSIFRELAPQQETYLMRLVAKRAVDICGAAIGLILFSPLFAAVAVAVKLSSRGPVFFRQLRYGRRRRTFGMFKFRSMVDHAEDLLSQIEHLNELQGPIFKIKDDPRVTSVGRFLRRTSIDELPQLWNVLIGDMSLVGPRPMSLRDVGLFSDAVLMRRFSVTPGMTGLWQVSGRSDVGFDQWVAMDCRYIDTWSISLDLKILFMTLSTVLRRSGAM